MLIYNGFRRYPVVMWLDKEVVGLVVQGVVGQSVGLCPNR